MVAMEMDFDFLQEQRQRNLPRLIEANYLLNLSSQELETVIMTELSANPALEVEERTICPSCGSAIDGGFCTTCLVNQNQNGETNTKPTDIEDDFDRIDTIYQQRSADEEFDEVTLIAAEMDMQGQLLADVRTVIEPEEYAIAECLIDALDERGFLDADLADIAALCQCTVADVERVLEVVQEIAPAGVAARDLRECLMLQLQFLRLSDVEIPALVDPIIESHLTELGNHRYQHIARQLRVSPDEVGEAHDFIQSYLSPHPMQSQLSKTWQSAAVTPYVSPDVLIGIVDGDLKIEITGSSQSQLRVNQMYDGLAARLRRRAKTEQNAAATAEVMAQTSDEDRDHIRDSVSRARQFISKIHQRRETLLKISTCIGELQEDFLREGVRELKPLTRSQVAQQIGVHESTVSRATANKYVMLPNRKVIPFSDFFTPSLSIKDVIKELIENESAAGHPLSDMRIRELLLQRGYRIARRTVAKYRAELRILPSTVR